jgi:hypothetical protein
MLAEGNQARPPTEVADRLPPIKTKTALSRVTNQRMTLINAQGILRGRNHPHTRRAADMIQPLINELAALIDTYYRGTP